MPALASSPQARVLPRSSCGDLGQRCTVVNGCFVQCRHLARGSRSRLRLVTGQSVDSTRAAASAATTQPLPGVKYSFLQGVQVLDADGYAVDLASLLPPSSAAITVLVFLTHYADLSSWELAQQLVKALPTLEAQVRCSCDTDNPCPLYPAKGQCTTALVDTHDGTASCTVRFLKSLRT